MKKPLSILLFFALSYSAFAQKNESIFEIMERTDISIQQAEQKANALFEKTGTGKGTGYKQFQRWLYERKFHTDQNGNYVNPSEEWNRYQFATANTAIQNSFITAGNWTEVGPFTPNPRGASGNIGVGRVSAMAIHPAAENIIYVGAPDGGIWKSTNSGANWTWLNDLINASWMSVFALAIDPNNQNVVFAGLGNGAGIIKSIDGGASWTSVGTSFGNRVRKILIHPSNSNIVFAATGNGIWRSVNAGVNWTRVHTGSKEDLEFKPNDLNTMYATGNDAWRSTDNGITWTQLTAAQGITNTGRTLVAVSPANPNYVYFCQANGDIFGRIYKSTDAGLSFTTTVVGNPTTGTNYFGYFSNGMDTRGQATYDMALDVSPTNVAEVYIGGIDAWKSTNEAVSFFPQSANALPNNIGYIHGDNHGLHWVNSTLYTITDGGIYKSTNAGDDWTDISAGLGIKQLYRFANSQTDANIMVIGAQDNGCVSRQAAGNWINWTPGDGMECLVSPTNDLKIWGLSQNGDLYRSIDGGNTVLSLGRPSPGNWVTPVVIHPTDDNILYGGFTGVFKSTDGGSTWTNLALGIITNLVTDLAISPSNPNQIYVSVGGTLFVTTDGGANWSSHDTPLISVNDICVDPTNPNKIWIAGLGFTVAAVSADAGVSFTNITGNLPIISARSIVVDNNTPRGIYIGMNLGIFHKLENVVNWTPFRDNLPLVPINELEILNATGKIRAATFGRGVWESPLASSQPTSGFTFNSPAAAVTNCPAPNIINNTLGTNVVGTFTNLITLSATAGVPAGTSITFGTNPVTPGNSCVVTLNNANTLAPGNYVVTITGTATGTSAQTRNITFTINTGTGPTIGMQPTNQSVCVGSNATFTVAAASANLQWQLSTNGGTAWVNIANATSSTLALPLVTLAQNNSRYRAMATNVCGNTISNVVTLTVTPTTTITAQPTSVTVCNGGNAAFCVTAIGGNLTFQWETAVDCAAQFTNVVGATSSCLNIANVTTAAAFRCKITETGSCNSTITSNCAELTLGALATVSEQPTNKEICANSNTTFSVGGTSTAPITFQWQVSTDTGTNWTNIIGATATTLQLTNVATTQNNNRFRCQLFTITCPIPTNSIAAELIVRSLPTAGLTASPLTSLLPGQTTVLQATVSLPSIAGNTISKTWFKDGMPFTNSHNDFTATLDKVGRYQVNIQERYASGLTCYGISPVINLTALTNDKLTIFPVPNDGRFTVSYFNASLSNSRKSVIVYDSKGTKVYHKQITVTGAYTFLNIDVKPIQPGVFIVVVDDEQGKRLAQGKIVIR